MNRTCCIALFFIVGIASAADMTVLGLTLGAPLRLPECSWISVHVTSTVLSKYYDRNQAKTCMQDKMSNMVGPPARVVAFDAKDGIPIVKDWQLWALESNGVLVGVMFDTNGLDWQERVLAALVAKYGKPSVESYERVQNTMGAKFDSKRASWSVGPIKVTFWGTFGRLDTGRVYIDLPEAAPLRQAWIDSIEARDRKL